jgi:hypothetical protein
MANIQVVSHERHKHKFWQKLNNYSFAKSEMASSLVAREVPTALVSMPIAFAKSENDYLLVAVQGFTQGNNLFVAPGHQWIGGYVPLAYRNYPFRLGVNPNNEKLLCIDEDSGTITSSSTENAFFDGSGAPDEKLAATFKALIQVEKDMIHTRNICALLHKHSLIEPWPIQVESAKGTDTVAGFFRINEQSLNSLNIEAFIELRDVGALMVAYGQLFSMQNLKLLGKIQEAIEQIRNNQEEMVNQKAQIKVTERNGTISFENL